MIRLTVPSIDEEDLQGVREVLSSGFLVQGARVASFEREIANYVGSRFAVAVANGTASLHLALLALGVGPGDVVITSAYSFVATANAIELCGAKPVFVDIQGDTFNLDPRHLGKVVEELMESQDTARRVKAILPVHSFGQIADMPEIMEIAERHGLPVVEDTGLCLRCQVVRSGGWQLGGPGMFQFSSS